MFQIFSLLGNKSNAAKISRYSDRLLKYIDKCGSDGFLSEGKKLGVAGGVWDAICSYIYKDIKVFKKVMLRLKFKLLLVSVFRKPFYSLYLIAKRVCFYMWSTVFPVEGCYIRIFVVDKNKNEVISALNSLKENDYITKWSERINGAFFFGRKNHKIMETGGLLVQFVDKPCVSSIDFSDIIESNDILELLKRKILLRHLVIYKKNV
jgi:hypothetical protein